MPLVKPNLSVQVAWVVVSRWSEAHFSLLTVGCASEGMNGSHCFKSRGALRIRVQASYVGD